MPRGGVRAARRSVKGTGIKRIWLTWRERARERERERERERSPRVCLRARRKGNERGRMTEQVLWSESDVCVWDVEEYSMVWIWRGREGAVGRSPVRLFVRRRNWCSLHLCVSAGREGGVCAGGHFEAGAVSGVPSGARRGWKSEEEARVGRGESGERREWGEARVGETNGGRRSGRRTVERERRRQREREREREPP